MYTNSQTREQILSIASLSKEMVCVKKKKWGKEDISLKTLN